MPCPDAAHLRRDGRITLVVITANLGGLQRSAFSLITKVLLAGAEIIDPTENVLNEAERDPVKQQLADELKKQL